MLVIRVFLGAVGALYAIFALWCAASPGFTSEAVGLHMEGGSGRSEYITVYGGLQMGLALAFAGGAWFQEHATAALVLCWLVHGSLTAFRLFTVATVDGIAWNTFAFAGLEAALFLGALGLWWFLA